MTGLLDQNRMRRSNGKHVASFSVNYCPLTFSGHPAIMSVTLAATRATA
jgi:hypothetical protein